jgi:hypothetical protein
VSKARRNCKTSEGAPCESLGKGALPRCALTKSYDVLQVSTHFVPGSYVPTNDKNLMKSFVYIKISIDRSTCGSQLTISLRHGICQTC